MSDRHYEDNSVSQPIETRRSMYSTPVRTERGYKVSWGHAVEVSEEELVQLYAVQQFQMQDFNPGVRQLCVWIGASSAQMVPGADGWGYSSGMEFLGRGGEPEGRSQDNPLDKGRSVVPGL